jgi:ferredoxin
MKFFFNNIEIKEKNIDFEKSILFNLIQNETKINHSCKIGVCLLCSLKVISGLEFLEIEMKHQNPKLIISCKTKFKKNLNENTIIKIESIKN